LFDLRCLVREKMVEFVREKYPNALPTTRVEMRVPDRKPAEPAPASRPESFPVV
jgi:hypothetical protein